MIQYGAYTPATIFAAKHEEQIKGRHPLPDGKLFRYSDRIVLFETKGLACVTCGIEGSVFLLEAHEEGVTPHVNLYAVTEAGEFVIMTKDHILPKSKGGKDALENYDTMCGPCNWAKGNTYEG